MKIGCFLIVSLLVVGCASRPPRCERRLTPINTPVRAATHAVVVGP